MMRLGKGISQRDLAKRVGVSGAYVTMLERGVRKNPSFSLLKRVAAALDVPVTDLWADKVRGMGESIDRLRGRLEPYWEAVDGLIDENVRPIVEPTHFGHFEGCQVKMKALWYLRSRVEELDAEYGRVVDALRSGGDLSHLPRSQDGARLYFPFFEAVEFENLLIQAKACLDCFSLAVGRVFQNRSGNLAALMNVLRKAGPRGGELLRHTESAEARLTGIVLDPGGKKKSIRDLIAHRERAFIHFRVGAYGRSDHALLAFDHPLTARLPNNNVTVVANEVWYATRTLVSESLPLVLRLLREQTSSIGRTQGGVALAR